MALKFDHWLLVAHENIKLLTGILLLPMEFVKIDKKLMDIDQISEKLMESKESKRNN